MPVSLLLVEGKLDVEVLTPLMLTLTSSPTVDRGGSKGELKPKCRDKRELQSSVAACYVRDRDFDFEPPDDTSRPTVDSLLGWRWSRHELENYLLEPDILAEVTGGSRATAEAALLAAASQILHYTAARWTVGTARRKLPPFRELPTRPSDKPECWVPAPHARTSVANHRWLHGHIKDFRDQVEPVLADPSTDAELLARTARLTALSDVDETLVWYSGKDLLAALEPKLYRTVDNNPIALRRALARWIREHPERTLELLPEWRALLALLSN